MTRPLNAELAHPQVERDLEDCESLMVALREAMAASDWEQASHLAHELGMAAMLLSRECDVRWENKDDNAAAAYHAEHDDRVPA